MGETLMVDADEVLNLLKKYQEEKENLAAQVVAPGKEKKKSKGKSMGSESEAERKLRRRKEEKKFWEKMGHVIPEMNSHVWRALDKFVQRSSLCPGLADPRPYSARVSRFTCRFRACRGRRFFFSNISFSTHACDATCVRLIFISAAPPNSLLLPRGALILWLVSPRAAPRVALPAVRLTAQPAMQLPQSALLFSWIQGTRSEKLGAPRPIVGGIGFRRQFSK